MEITAQSELLQLCNLQSCWLWNYCFEDRDWFQDNFGASKLAFKSDCYQFTSSLQFEMAKVGNNMWCVCHKGTINCDKSAKTTTPLPSAQVVNLVIFLFKVKAVKWSYHFSVKSTFCSNYITICVGISEFLFGIWHSCRLWMSAESFGTKLSPVSYFRIQQEDTSQRHETCLGGTDQLRSTATCCQFVCVNAYIICRPLQMSLKLIAVSLSTDCNCW